MRPVTLALCALVLVGSASSQERRAVALPESAQRAAEIAAHLERATAALRAWRAEIEAGAVVEPAEIQRMQHALQSLLADFGTIAERARGNAERVRLADSAAPAQADPVEQQLEQRAWPLSKIWVDDARALGEGSAERRARSLAEIRTALESSDAVGNLAALQALRQLGDVEYDKSSYRALILPFAREARGATLLGALYALANTEKEPGDLALVHSGWERDPAALSGSVLHLMFMFGGGDLKARSEEIALELLVDDSNLRRKGFNGLWGARVGPALEARVLELSRSSDRDLRHDAIYFGLSTFQDKSDAVCAALIEALADPDHNNSGRALWGLGHGVPAAQRPRVVEALIELHAARSDRSTRESCERIVGQYGGEQALARLAR